MRRCATGDTERRGLMGEPVYARGIDLLEGIVAMLTKMT